MQARLWKTMIQTAMIIRSILLALVAVAAVNAPAFAGPVTSLSLDQGWSFRLDPADPVARTRAAEVSWRPATVPGVVQTDLLAAGRIADPYFGNNEGQLQWIGLADWQYRKTLQVDAALLARRRLDLVFDGLDTFATVFVNGKPLLTADNQHRRWRADARALLKLGDNEIQIHFSSPIRKLQPDVLKRPYVLPGAYDSAFGDEPPAKHTSTYVRKSPYHYGWDWGPRYVTQGIWRSVRLEAWDDVRLESFRVAQDHVDADAARLSAAFEIEAAVPGTVTLSVEVHDPDGRALAPVTRTVALVAGSNRISAPIVLARPRLWYPAGYGAQDLYEISGAIIAVDGQVVASSQRRTGVRTVELRREADVWGKSFAFVVNGVPIFAKGANLIPFDSFSPRVTPTTLRDVLASARDANMNMLRVWGGGEYQSDAFYDMADEMGLMIWQDFMFGGAIPPYDVAFRENSRQEALEQVRRLGDHPSIVIWCGNNEVQTGWENWGDRIAFKDTIAPAEREKIVTGMTVLFGQVLRGAVAQYDADTPYWASSPSTDFDGPADQLTDGDRHYWGVWGGAPVEDYLDVSPRFMSEYGLQSMPEMRTIATFARAEDLSITSTVMRAHQKYAKGEGNDRLLLYIRRNYGEPRDFASFVYLSQVMQAEGIALAALHHRASRPQTMGSLYWQLNDVWPGASWSSIDYLGRWKALQFHARRFYAPVAISALRRNGVTTIKLISDRATPVNARWRLRVMDVAGKLLWDQSATATGAPLAATSLAMLNDATILKGADPRRTFAVVDLVENDRQLSRALVFFAPAKTMDLEDPKLTARVEPDGEDYRVIVRAAALARAVWIDVGADARLSDNAVDILPGETLILKVKTKADLAALSQGLSVRSLWGATTAVAP